MKIEYIIFLILFSAVGCRTTVKWAAPFEATPSVGAASARILVVTHDSVVLRELAVSLKNHLSMALKPSFSEVKNKNIRAEFPTDKQELAALIQDFKPDYILSIAPAYIRSRPFKMAGYTVPKVREVHWQYRLVAASEPDRILWSKKLIINHLFDSEIIAAARKAALLVSKEWPTRQ